MNVGPGEATTTSERSLGQGSPNFSGSPGPHLIFHTFLWVKQNLFYK